MACPQSFAPGVPPDYYRSIVDSEDGHWWQAGMRSITTALLGDRLRTRGVRLLDAGCGTGGFLRWAIDSNPGVEAAGCDIASAAIELARARVSEGDLRVASLREIPFGDAAFDLVVTNDVLQHVPEDELGSSLAELRRVIAPGGALLVRTNGARRFRRARSDWCVFDRSTLASGLQAAGFACERVTYANMAMSALAAARGNAPEPPTAERHGIPAPSAGGQRQRLALRLLALEAGYLARPGRSLPYGHTLFALATPAP